MFAVGDDGTRVRFNGQSWSAQASGTTEDLRAVWGSSPDNVYASGTNGTMVRHGP